MRAKERGILRKFQNNLGGAVINNHPCSPSAQIPSPGKNALLSTARTTIRRFIPHDAQDLYEILSDKEVTRFEPYEPFTLEKSREEAASRAQNDCFYAVCLTETGKLIGSLYLAPEDFGAWEIGYVFSRAYQGRGLAAESAAALLEYAFSALGARRIVAACSTQNTRSWKLLERLGLRREGTLLQNVSFKTDGDGRPVWFDSHCYAILKPEWESRRKTGGSVL